MGAPVDLTGQVFGRLTVLGQSGHIKAGVEKKRAWLCRCECGNECVRAGHLLRSGHTKSCGCFRREATGAARRTHGASADQGRKRTYKIWKNMRSRCERESETGYHYYGGRGISVCPKWASYEAFEADMGVCPRGYSIERRDVNGNYEPSNCEWLPRRLQSRNRRDTRLVQYRGRITSLAEACELSGVSAMYVHGDVYRKSIDHQTAFDMRLAKAQPHGC